jgi:hemoglobin-like flavoprotein
VTPAQQELVRLTFSKLAVMPEVAAALFYERLFAANPSFRSLFSQDMRVQGVKLMTTLTLVVYNLHQPGQAGDPRSRRPARRLRRQPRRL